MTAHKNSRLLPCHRGVFGVSVEPVEVCFCGLGLPDCVPPIFFNVGGQARSGRVVGRCSSIEGSLPCVSTWQRVFTVPWCTTKATRHQSHFAVRWRTTKTNCARQCLGAHGKGRGHGKGAIIAHMHGRPAPYPLTLSLPAAPLLAHSQPRRRRLPAKPPEPPPPPSQAAGTAAASQPSRRPAQLLTAHRPAQPRPPPLSCRTRPAAPAEAPQPPCALALAPGRRCLDA
jgi:hypothetical protein